MFIGDYSTTKSGVELGIAVTDLDGSAYCVSLSIVVRAHVVGVQRLDVRTSLGPVFRSGMFLCDQYRGLPRSIVL